MADEEEGLVRVSSGVVLRPKTVPAWVIQDAIRRLSKPEPPMAINSAKDREEPDESDPVYLRNYAEWVEEQNRISADAMLLLGVDVVSVPAGFPGVDDPSWREEVEFLGVSLEGIPPRLAWLKYCAVRSQGDLASIVLPIARLSFVREEDVAEALASFQSRTPRVADSGAILAPVSPDGDHLPANGARARARAGRA